jgi:hypothetical protein
MQLNDFIEEISPHLVDMRDGLLNRNWKTVIAAYVAITDDDTFADDDKNKNAPETKKAGRPKKIKELEPQTDDLPPQEEKALSRGLTVQKVKTKNASKRNDDGLEKEMTIVSGPYDPKEADRNKKAFDRARSTMPVVNRKERVTDNSDDIKATIRLNMNNNVRKD